MLAILLGVSNNFLTLFVGTSILVWKFRLLFVTAVKINCGSDKGSICHLLKKKIFSLYVQSNMLMYIG